MFDVSCMSTYSYIEVCSILIIYLPLFFLTSSDMFHWLRQDQVVRDYLNPKIQAESVEFSYRLNISRVETENDDAFGEARKHRG